jgi:histone demethylase JARID1
MSNSNGVYAGDERGDDPQSPFNDDAPAGHIYSLAEFQFRAEDWKTKYFGESEDVGEHDVENAFWERIQDNRGEDKQSTETEYACGLPVGSYGSGFAQAERDASDASTYDVWNLNVLPFSDKAMARYIDEDVPALVEPRLSIGAVFSCQSWSFEEAFAYSVSYQHIGDTRTWYAVPGHNYQEFRGILASTVEQNNSNDLADSDCMITPEMIHGRGRGLGVFSIDQRPGEFVIVFPQAYTCHFNQGFNVVETVNLLPISDWLPYGREFEQFCRQLHTRPPFCIDRALLNVAEAPTPISTAKE